MFLEPHEHFGAPAGPEGINESFDTLGFGGCVGAMEQHRFPWQMQRDSEAASGPRAADSTWQLQTSNVTVPSSRGHGTVGDSVAADSFREGSIWQLPISSGTFASIDTPGGPGEVRDDSGTAGSFRGDSNWQLPTSSGTSALFKVDEGLVATETVGNSIADFTWQPGRVTNSVALRGSHVRSFRVDSTLELPAFETVACFGDTGGLGAVCAFEAAETSREDPTLQITTYPETVANSGTVGESGVVGTSVIAEGFSRSDPSRQPLSFHGTLSSSGAAQVPEATETFRADLTWQLSTSGTVACFGAVGGHESFGAAESFRAGPNLQLSTSVASSVSVKELGSVGTSGANPLLQVGAEGNSAIMNRNVICVITEQPASKALRFRYVCEGRSAGSIPGINSTLQKKTYPSIQIKNYRGREVLEAVVSCVTKDSPHRPHPHCLVGRGCKDGVFRMEVDPETMTMSFVNLGIQCIKKNDIKEALNKREKLKIDPFRTGFDHKNQSSGIDLNAVRLCFQVFRKGEDRFIGLTEPVVSNPIYDKKALSDLVIHSLSDVSATVHGGKKIILLCEKVVKGDIAVRLFEEANNQIVWEEQVISLEVHKQVAIQFYTPPYKDINVTESVQVQIQLVRPSDKATSEARPFQLTPHQSALNFEVKRKIPKHDVAKQLGAVDAGFKMGMGAANQAVPSTSGAYCQSPPTYGTPSSSAAQGTNPNNTEMAFTTDMYAQQYSNDLSSGLLDSEDLKDVYDAVLVDFFNFKDGRLSVTNSLERITINSVQSSNENNFPPTGGNAGDSNMFYDGTW